MKKSLTSWQIGGFVFTAVGGVVLHFLYEWSGEALPIALFSAVNESIWEHLKLLYLPLVGYALLTARWVAPDYPGYWCAKLWSTLAGLVSIPLLYYAYTGALGVSADWFNIFLFFLSAALAYAVDTHLLRHSLPCRHPKLAIGILVGLFLLFAVCTFSPPHLPLFRDPVTGTYGV